MSKTMRSVDTRFWVDTWVRKLNALDRYAFLYFLTNTHTTWCGVYELDVSMAAFESGIDERDLLHTILPRLSPKVVYIDGWIYVPKWDKYHLSGNGSMSPQQKKGMEDAWKLVPETVVAKIKAISEKQIPYTEGIGGVSASASASANTLGETSSPELKDKNIDMGWNNKSDDFEEGVVNLDESLTLVPEKKTPTRKYPNASAIRKVFQEVLGKNPADWNKNTTVLQACENLYTERGIEKVRNALEFYKENHEKEYCPVINSPVDLDRKYTNLSAFKVKNEN
jgi:hypothetical protein